MTKKFPFPLEDDEEALTFRILINICECGEPFFALYCQDEVGGGPGYESYIFFIGKDSNKPETYSQGYISWEDRFNTEHVDS